MRLVHTDDSKEALKNCEELWRTWEILLVQQRITQMIMMKNIMKIKFNSDDDVILKKTLDLHNIIIGVRSVFHDGNNFF